MVLRRFHDTHAFNLSLDHERTVVTRNNREGSGIVYLTDELAVDESCFFRVESVDPLTDGLNSLSLVIGLTTCDSSVVTNFPFHVIEACQPSHDCMGHTVTIRVTCAHLMHDEIRVQRKAAGVLHVFVNDVPQFSLNDPNDSIFPFSKSAIYPFLMLTGSVSSVRSVSPSDIVPLIENVNTRFGLMEKGDRNEMCCIICMDRNITHMAVPCNHAAFCDTDASEHMRTSKACPICRKKVTSFVRIFLS